MTLVGIGKGQSGEALANAIDAGLTDLGENYFQEALRKLPLLPPVRKHFVGRVRPTLRSYA